MASIPSSATDIPNIAQSHTRERISAQALRDTPDTNNPIIEEIFMAYSIVRSVIAWTICGSLVSAQEVLLDLKDDIAFINQPGRAVGDLDGDGAQDISIAGPTKMTVLSGRTMSVHWEFSFEGWSSVGVGVTNIGDFNGDLVADLIVTGNIGTGSASVIVSGIDGTTLSDEFFTGTKVVDGGDFNADGIGDFYSLVTLMGHHLPPQLEYRIYSGSDFSILQSGPIASGQSVFTAGDKNGDNYADLWIEDVDHEINGVPVDRLVLQSGADGSELAEILPLPGFVNPGWSTVPDLDGDGHDELRLRGSYDNPNWAFFSGLTYEFLYQIDSTSVSARILSSNLGDLNGDGFDDYVQNAGPRGWPANPLEIASGITGNSLFQLQQEITSPSATRVGDLDGDGIDDLLINGGEFGTLNKRVVVVAGAPLWLKPSHKPVAPGSMLKMTVTESWQGSPVVLMLRQFNGQEFFQPITPLFYTGASATAEFSFFVPVDLSGTEYGVQAYGIDLAGSLIASAIETVQVF